MEITTIGPFLHYFDRLRERTLNVFEYVPPEKVEWRPDTGRFSFGDQLRHLANIERYMYAENAFGRPSRYPGHGKEFADGYDEILSYAKQLHEESMEMFSQLSDEDLQQKTETPAGTPITVWKWLRAMTEHEVHHRGQLFLMLRKIDIQPPRLFGLTSEEVRARSEEL